ncbi:helix-turn-helix transcriptional regulator [Streptomyces sp. CB02009]|uniref:helix-turn-helix transcriptional regulator n=1 Tax=Streptomyces sp. CB02009 TaxID=1703938 RepID=UPI00093A561B|nr:LuxR family transcriptional regulator [Streptomyces sp. CB02009]
MGKPPERRQQLRERDTALHAVTGVTESLARGGTPRPVLLEGRGGLGKTALLDAAEVCAGQHGVRVIRVRSTILEQGLPLGLVRQMTQQGLAGPGPRLADGSPTGPALPVPGRGAHGAGQDDYALFHAVLSAVSRETGAEPVLFLADDLQWADAASLRFLLYLLPRLRPLRAGFIGALRPDSERHANQGLLSMLVDDVGDTLLGLAPLTAHGIGQLAHDVFGKEAAGPFTEALLRLSRGIPLLARELAVEAVLRGVDPVAGNTETLASLRPRSLALRARLWLDRVEETSARLARSAAVLGEGTPLAVVAEHARVTPWQAPSAYAELQGAGLADDAPPSGSGPRLFVFSSPLAGTSVERTLTADELITGHLRATVVLSARDAPPDQIAGHLLHVPAPARLAGVYGILHAAADTALRRGEPERACAYLARCLEETTDAAAREETLTRMGGLALRFDVSRAVSYYRQAVAASPGGRAPLLSALSAALWLRGDGDAAVASAAEALSRSETARDRSALRYRIRMMSLGLGTSASPSHGSTAPRPPRTDVAGEVSFDGFEALTEAFAGQRSAVDKARLGVRQTAHEEAHLRMHAKGPAWYVLLAAEVPDAMEILDNEMRLARRQGALSVAAPVYACRGLGHWWEGRLDRAATDLARAVHLTDRTHSAAGRAFAGPFLAGVLTERGSLDRARQVLDWSEPEEDGPGPVLTYLRDITRARLLRLCGRTADALHAATEAGRAFYGFGGTNPAFCAWRSEAARCHHLMGETDTARQLVSDEVTLARRWGAARPLGRALRLAALLQGPQGEPEDFEESVEVLRDSPARLEYAKSLVAYGSALRRAGRTAAARTNLTEALDLANAANAVPLSDHALAELRLSGARPRRRAASGRDSLTPGETRVARMAAAGLSNSEIARRLFVTGKTVEVHLGNVYRKLGIPGRHQLEQALR